MNQETNTQLADENLLYFYKLPKLIVNSQQNIVGVLDASFSMESYWDNIAQSWKKFVREPETQDFRSTFSTFTFSHTLMYQKNNNLSQQMNLYGGYQSDIERAILKLINYINIMGLSFGSLTIYFVSDGVDYDPSTIIERLQKIPRVSYQSRVICIALGTDFPIELSVELRRIFNNSDKNVPFIDKVANPNYLYKHLYQHKYPRSHKIKFDTPINIFPWAQSPVHKTKLMPVWVYVQGQQYLRIKLKNKGEEQRIKIKGKTKLDLLEQVELSEFYFDHLVQIQDNKQKQMNANTALNFLRRHVYPKALNDLSIFKLQQRIVQRNQNITLSTWIFKFNALISFEQLTSQEKENLILKKMSAEKLFRSKYLAITHSDFIKAKDEFLKILIETFIEDDESRSVITLQSMSEILKQHDIVEAINNCNSLPELLLTLPIVGLSIYVDRSNNQVYDSFKIVVQNISRHHKYIDSVSLLSNNNLFVFNTGSQGVEKVNCLLPVIDNKSMTKIITSTLFNMIVNCVVNEIINAQNHETFIGLLSKTYIYLLSLEETRWSQDLKQKILYTFEVLVDQNLTYQKINKIVQSDPEKAFRIQQQHAFQKFKYIFIVMFFFLNNFTGLNYGIYFMAEVVRKKYSGYNNFSKFKLDRNIGRSLQIQKILRDLIILRNW